MSTGTNGNTHGGALRVLAVTARYPPLVGGTEMHTYETSRRIAAAGHDVTVLTTNPRNELAEDELLEGVRIIRVPEWPNGTDFHFAPRIYRTILDGDWDIIHCQGYHTLVGPLAMLAAQRAHIPYVVTFHSGGHSSGLRKSVRRMQWRVLRPLFAQAERLIGVSSFEAELFRDRLRLAPEKFVIIPNGAQLPESGSVMQAESESALILSIGRLERYKGHHRLLAALPLVARQRPDVRLRIVGSGPYEATLRHMARELNVADRVEIRAVSGSERDEMASLISSASLVALLSEYESQGIAVSEALKLKRPVLVADSSALGDIARQGLASAVSLESTPQQIAEAVLQQLAQPLVPSDIELPSWDDCARELEDLYRAVVRTPMCAS